MKYAIRCEYVDKMMHVSLVIVIILYHPQLTTHHMHVYVAKESE